MEKQKKIPILRFPKFEQEWVSTKLTDKSSFISKGTTPKAFTENGINYIKIESLVDTKIDLRKCLFISEDTHFGELKRSQLQEGDILFAIAGATIGKIGIVTKNILPANTNQALAIIRLSDKQQIKFILSVLGATTMKRYIKNCISVGAQPNLNLQQIGDFKFSLPTLPEQQKIAAFLTAVDERIGQLKKKKALLEQYKKGVMQQIFSRQIRFEQDDGSDFPEWEEKKLGEVFEEISQSVGQGEIPTYSISAGVGFVSQMEKFGKDISGKQNENYIVVGPNEFSYNKGNSKKYKYGCIYLNTFTHSIAVPKVFISFKLHDSKMASSYFAKLFENHFLDRELRKIISSSARMDGLLNVNKKNFFGIRIPVPSSQEQTKIANFLSTIDDKINQCNSRIEKAELWKKGLLQQMFV